MKTDNNNDRIEEMLNSLDGTERASPVPYFFTRLQQKLATNHNSSRSGISHWISRPVVALSVLILFILLNIAVILNYNSEDAFDESSDFNSIATLNILDEETP